MLPKVSYRIRGHMTMHGMQAISMGELQPRHVDDHLLGVAPGDCQRKLAANIRNAAHIDALVHGPATQTTRTRTPDDLHTMSKKNCNCDRTPTTSPLTLGPDMEYLGCLQASTRTHELRVIYRVQANCLGGVSHWSCCRPAGPGNTWRLPIIPPHGQRPCCTRRCTRGQRNKEANRVCKQMTEMFI